MTGLTCFCRMRACPPITWLCSLPWHAWVPVRWVIGQELTVRASHPYLCTFDSRTSCGHFFIAAVAFIVFLDTNSYVQKNVRTTAKWLQIVAVRLLRYQNIGFWNSSPQNLTPIIIREERTNTIQYVNQVKHSLKITPRVLILCHQLIFSAFY